ncbi:MAG: 2TM domain-containing protein [Acidimicrobiia bacterium]|nr:2TM domain-containing protein [Acidimicrobiia bacterium]MDH5292726.1 2TM domain-containing protein [Acidimicrobiia bacterium]
MTSIEAKRDAALERVKAKRDFATHVIAYVVVNALLVVIWAATGRGYFWPLWPIAGWGVGLVLNAWTVYFSRPITEGDIQREMERDI